MPWWKARRIAGYESPLQLEDGDRVGVVGGGPAGSFFSYFLLEDAERLGLELSLDIYEPRDFGKVGPAGCNMCGGVVSESLVQHLAGEGIILPPDVLRRGIDAYSMHMDVGSLRIATPLHEKRIAAIHRGAGPRGTPPKEAKIGLDQFLLTLAIEKGATRIGERVEKILWENGRPRLFTPRQARTYDLVACAVGVNSPVLKLFEDLKTGYRAPRSTKTYICEFLLGQENVRSWLGSTMHVFLLNLPRLEFAAIIPKGDYVTVCLLGRDIDRALVKSFLTSEEVRRCMPPGWELPEEFCHCSPKISTSAARQPYADRLVFVGDCGSTRLYKDGIGAAYRTAKAAATTAAFSGITAEDFRRSFQPICKGIDRDNLLGRGVFLATTVIQHSRTLRRGLWRMVGREQSGPGKRRMSLVLWDTFTGSAPYQEVFLRSLHPSFLLRLFWETVRGLRNGSKPDHEREVAC